jgi:hypothetical protein
MLGILVTIVPENSFLGDCGEQQYRWNDPMDEIEKGKKPPCHSRHNKESNFSTRHQ